MQQPSWIRQPGWGWLGWNGGVRLRLWWDQVAVVVGSGCGCGGVRLWADRECDGDTEGEQKAVQPWRAGVGLAGHVLGRALTPPHVRICSRVCGAWGKRRPPRFAGQGNRVHHH